MKVQIITGLIILISIIYTPVVFSETVDIDPITFYANHDAFISEKNQNANYGTLEYLKVKSNDGGTSCTIWKHETLVSFDLTGIPSNVYIIYAKLYLYYYSYDDNDPKGRTLSAYLLGESWDENTVNYNNRPTRSGKTTATSTVIDSFEWMFWNVTVDVQNYLDNSCNNYGWIICDKDSWGNVDIPTPVFYSKENSQYKPYIEIKYSYEKPNNPPIADPGGPYSGYANYSVLLNASDSNDTDGTITGYRWDFNNDSNWDTEWLQVPKIYHTYNNTGNYTINLQIIDNKNTTSSNTTWANITLRPNDKPTANFTYKPYYPIIDEYINFTDTSNDSDGTNTNWLWDFGDNSTSYAQNPIHKYSNIGTYTVNLTVTDNRGGKDYKVKEIIVRDYLRGDINQNGTIDRDDLIYLIRYIYCDGPEPDPIYFADINGDGVVDYKDLFL